VIARGRPYPRWCSLRVPLASCLPVGVSTLAHIGDPSRGARIAPCPEHSSRTSDRGSRPSTRAGSSSTSATPSGGSRRGGARGAPFESEYGDPPVEFAQFGINVTVLEPGQTGLYHAESNQEGFLVLSGECALLVEDEERRLRPWDFFHSCPWTEHGFVGAGEGRV
jgi:quercetin dioxygenase-like cupin family protein